MVKWDNQENNVMVIVTVNGGDFSVNPLSTNPTKWSNTLNQFVGYCMFQVAITCSKLTIETLEQGVKYVQN